MCIRDRLLSGQPRFIEEGAKYIIPNVCEGNNVDTFCHFWMDDDLVTKPYKYGGDGEWVNQRIDSKAVDKAVEIYKPITYAVDRSKSFADSDVHFEIPKNKYWGGGEPGDQEGFRNRTVNNCLSYFYSLNEVNKLKKEYELSLIHI